MVKRMIICKICKKSKNESDFPSIIWEMGYPPICFDCYDSDEAQKLILDTIDAQQKEIERRMNHNETVKKLKREQVYEGQYDWMGDY